MGPDVESRSAPITDRGLSLLVVFTASALTVVARLLDDS